MVTKSPTTTISEYASFGNELNLKALISRECRRVCCVLTVLFLLWPREKRIIKSRYFWVPPIWYPGCLLENQKRDRLIHWCTRKTQEFTI